MAEEVKQPFECVVSADLFRRASVAISKEETRYYLNGVYVEPCEHGGVLLVATDGKRILVFHDVDGIAPNGPGIVSLNKDMVRAIAARSWRLPNWLGPVTGGGAKKRLVVVRGSKAAIAEVAAVKDEPLDYGAVIVMADAPTKDVGAYQWMGAIIDGAFPDWRRAVGVPAKTPQELHPVDTKLLAPMADALSGGKKSAACRLVPSDGKPGGPVFVFQDAETSCFGIIMPMRPIRETSSLPDWMSRPSAMAAE